MPLQNEHNFALLNRNSMSAVAGAMILAVVLAVVIAPDAPGWLVFTWLLLVLLVNALRLVHLRRLGSGDNGALADRYNLILVFAAGTLWGASILVCTQQCDPMRLMLLVIVLAGLATGATITLAGTRRAYPLFVVPMLLPLQLVLLSHGTGVYLALAAAAFLFMMVMLGVASSIHAYISNYARLLREERSQRRVMELLAGATPLPEILTAIVTEFEQHNPGTLCSVLLLDSAGERLHNGAAPHLPATYNEAIDGILIGPHVGCCGTAAYTGKRVVVDDIQTHPDWAGLAHLATEAGLRACWSEPIFGSAGKVLGTFAIYHRESCSPDDEELRQIESAGQLAGVAIERGRLQDELLLAAMVYQNSAEAMVVTDHEDRVIAINPAFTQITGYTEAEIVGHHIGVYRAGAAEDAAYHAMTEAVLTTGHWQGELWNVRKSGERFAEWVTVNSIFGVTGEVHLRVSLISDITEQKHSDELIWKQANYDALTGLPNRRLFRDRLELELRKSHRAENRMALLFLDLDRFKEVNDTLGHDAGDLLLVQAARRISSCVRESDTVARLGGDEFTIILSELGDGSSVERIAHDIVRRLAEPFRIEDEVVYVSASIGITVYPDDSTEVDGLLRNADQAMYEAKNAGRNRYSFFTGAMQQAARERLRLVADLRTAIGAGQLLVEYQPIVDMRTRTIRKAEALLRWQHPVLGRIEPGRFIPLAEEVGLIGDIGCWVFEQAAHQAALWSRLADDGFRVSVNVSPLQFQPGSQIEGMQAWLEHMGPVCANMMVEITEGLLLEGDPSVAEQLGKFKSAGMIVAIDDFGTGYSALAYLKKFQIDVLKIDRTFVRDLSSDPNDRALAESIIAMAHKLGLSVVAEGVETEQQHQLLLAAGCDFAQGYLYARPLPAAEFGALLTRAPTSSPA